MRASALAAVVLLGACRREAPADPKWVEGLEKFHRGRERSIAGPDGWVTLVGRFALKNGANPVGADPKSAAVLPADRSPAQLGTLVLEAGSLFWTTAQGASVTVNGAPVASLQVADDSRGKPTVLEAGSLRLHVLRRGDAFMLRVKDQQAPARVAFKGLQWFEPDAKWHVKAKLEPSPPGTTLPIVNVLNHTEAMPSPGHLVFTVEGHEHRLAALQEDEPGLFVIFKDGTAGKGTYPSGRFINTPAVGADGFVDLDFNRAYSPPCAFTSFATCPLPPRENHLAVEIAAGEKYSGHP
ncbi:MAG: DUF1684 domain-containing protein [Archangiaceae bacterium]|nr:DUF1684 domain-containing protein [Archangiaceae bacterium]